MAPVNAEKDDAKKPSETDARGGVRFGTGVAYDDGLYSAGAEDIGYVKELVDDDHSGDEADEGVDEGRLSSHPSTRRNATVVSRDEIIIIGWGARQQKCFATNNLHVTHVIYLICFVSRMEEKTMIRSKIQLLVQGLLIRKWRIESLAITNANMIV